MGYPMGGSTHVNPLSEVNIAVRVPISVGRHYLSTIRGHKRLTMEAIHRRLTAELGGRDLGAACVSKQSIQTKRTGLCVGSRAFPAVCTGTLRARLSLLGCVRVQVLCMCGADAYEQHKCSQADVTLRFRYKGPDLDLSSLGVGTATKAEPERLCSSCWYSLA